MRRETRDINGNPNGYIVTLWNVHEQEWKPDQVYLTVVNPGCAKGPHLHGKRCGRFICIKGNVDLIKQYKENDQTHYIYDRTGEDYDYRLIEVPAGVAAELRNTGNEPALVINMPTPAWRPEDQDELPIDDWDPFEQPQRIDYKGRSVNETH
jgi:dTDP-4-dehydrorhamnose 3,5-epimerase-like enzyme